MRSVATVRRAITVAALVAAIAAPAASQSVPTWAREQLAGWYKAFNAGDAKGIAALYTVDAVLLVEGQSALRGRGAIEAFHVTMATQKKFACLGVFDGFQVVGSDAAGWGHDECTETPRAGGAAKKTKSRWLSIYEKQPDGKWLIVRDGGEDIKP
jgi:uncharacterized protein (TIGR02246 family)